MLQLLDYSAIGWGLGAGLGLGLISGLVLGLGMASDIGRDNDTPGPDQEEMLEKELVNSAHQPAAQLQVVLLSVVISLITGALTARLSLQAPLLNAAALGGLATVLSLILGRLDASMPRAVFWGGAIATLPATLLGAWLIG